MFKEKLVGQCLEIVIESFYSCMLCREVVQKPTPESSWFERKKRHRKKEMVLEMRLGNYNSIVLENKEQTGSQHGSKLNSAEKEIFKVL